VDPNHFPGEREIHQMRKFKMSPWLGAAWAAWRAEKYSRRGEG
jgi:hypothetical protein